ncbi:uncharacterized protein LOC113385078 [Ctenocephalides felis]|uniref:uncharacterized protein LOC113385078 n=1 Tax=Ctenocephalides felis TaxID=7515 RepID=UPI000E6E39C2|nr:uncharacterized protein LOC113385078 [Ctenocephalides felis]
MLVNLVSFLECFISKDFSSCSLIKEDLRDYHQRHYYHGQFALLTSTWSFKLHATKYKTSELITEQDLCLGLVRIESLRVPSSVKSGSSQGVLLDCDYDLSDPYGLVVKWYFSPRGGTGLRRVYQWIAGQKPLAFGVFKNAVNLSYKASDNPNFQHRALNLIRPTWNMSGTYQCVVETYNDGTAKESSDMLVYSPEKNFQLIHEKNHIDSFRLICSAENLFPTPVMSFRVGNKVLIATENNVSQSRSSLYDIRVGTELGFDDLSEEPSEVTCELSLPEANYTVRQEALIYKNLPKVVPKSAASADLTALDSTNFTTGNSANIPVPYLYIVLIFCIFSRFLNHPHSATT